MTNKQNFSKTLIWLVGFSGLPLGIFIGVATFSIMFYLNPDGTAWIPPFLGFVFGTLTLCGMVELAVSLDKKFQIGYMENKH